MNKLNDLGYIALYSRAEPRVPLGELGGVSQRVVWELLVTFHDWLGYPNVPHDPSEALGLLGASAFIVLLVACSF